MTQLPSRPAIERYVKANASDARMTAVMNLLEWMDTAETREDFLLFLEGVDRNGVFTVPYLNIVVQYGSDSEHLKKAIEFNIIKKKNNG